MIIKYRLGLIFAGIFIICIIIFVTFFLFRSKSDIYEIKSFATGNLNNDKASEILMLVGRKKYIFASKLFIATPKTKKEIKIKSSLKPWKVRIADVDGDGINEVILGVYKKTRFDPVYDNRLFVYSFDGKSLFSKWLGSRLANRFSDFEFGDVDMDGKDELISVEIDANAYQQKIIIYDWKGFGFIAKTEIK